MKYSLRKTAWAAFLAAVVLLLVMAVLAYQTTKLLVASEHWVEHTREVQQILEDLCSNSLSANSARRGFVITGNPAMLQGYKSAIRKAPENLAHLRQLTSDNPARLGEVGRLQSVLNQHFAMLQDSIDLKSSGHDDTRRQLEITEQSAAAAAEVRTLVDHMEGEEENLLQQRQASSQEIYGHTRVLIVAAFGVALCLLAAEFYLLNLQFTKRELSEQQARQIRELVDAFFSSSTVGFGILDSNLRYQRVNETLARMAEMQPDALPGKSVHDVFGEPALSVESLYQNLLVKGQAILDREVSSATTGRPGDGRRWLVNYFPIRNEQNEVHQIGVIALDVTARRQAEKAIRRLSARLINLQDEERRRIAREIHDGLGQYLVALKLMIEMLKSSAGAERRGSFAECVEVLDKCISETRTLSHLLHPPLLDQAGFASAAGWFVSGFSQRSGIPVALDVPLEFPRLPDATEITLFRALQEGLTNIHRHSRSPSAEIRLQSDAEQVTLEMRDHGCGVPAHILQQLQDGGAQSGVGLAGMQERVNELGGQFDVQSDGTGTLLRITIPVLNPGGLRPAGEAERDSEVSTA
jgi:PAS domain S-box-containing protein